MNKSCLICNSPLYETIHSVNSSNGIIYKYSCEEMSCQLYPYTKYYSILNGINCIRSLIILDINKRYYSLLFDKEKCVTEVGIMVDFMFPDKIPNSPNSVYVSKNICTLNYAETFSDITSASKILSKILKMKLFI